MIESENEGHELGVISQLLARCVDRVARGAIKGSWLYQQYADLLGVCPLDYERTWMYRRTFVLGPIGELQYQVWSAACSSPSERERIKEELCRIEEEGLALTAAERKRTLDMNLAGLTGGLVSEAQVLSYEAFKDLPDCESWKGDYDPWLQHLAQVEPRWFEEDLFPALALASHLRGYSADRLKLTQRAVTEMVEQGFDIESKFVYPVRAAAFEAGIIHLRIGELYSHLNLAYPRRRKLELLGNEF